MRRTRAAALFFAGAAFAVGAVVALDAARALPRRYSPYRKLNLFTKVLTYVENSYVEEVDDSRLIYGAIKGMLGELDPHSAFMSPEQYRQLKADTQGEFGGVGIEVGIRDGWIIVIAPIEGTPADRAGLKPGDRLVSINGKSAEGITMDRAVRKMRGPRGTRVRLQVRRKGHAKPLSFEIVREVIKVASVTSKLLGPQIGYLRVGSFQQRTSQQLAAALERLAAKAKLKGIVLDLRNNPGGLLDQAVRVADLFLDKGVIVSTTGKGGKVVEVEHAHSKGTFERVPIVCLVNGGSASAAEIVAGALQDHKRAVVMGTQTFGKASVQTIIDLDDGSGLKLTVARYATPSGRSIQQQGIEPDVVVLEKSPPPKPVAKPRTKAHGSTATTKAAGAANSRARTARLDDFQLQTALDHLRAAEIFRGQNG